MIPRLIDAAARRASAADLTQKTDETTTVVLRGGRTVHASVAASQGTSLRVVAEGRIGIAGTADEDGESLLARALASAAAGEPGTLLLPVPVPLPQVITHAPRAAAAGVNELVAPGLLLRDRLGTDRLEVTVTLERSLGSVRVANTSGLDAGYDVTLVTVALEASRIRGGRRVTVPIGWAGADLPALTDVEQWVSIVRQRLVWMEREAEVPAGVRRVGFLPAAMGMLIAPVEQALLGKAALHGGSPLVRRRGARAYSDQVTLEDDPLAEGRPGSRPLDDEGTASRRLSLVRAGVVENMVYDLETASRVGAQPTGHGRRTTFGKAHAACSNVVMAPGPATWPELLAAIGDGVLIERLQPPASLNLVGGTFAQPASLAWRVEQGEVTGLVPEVTVAGNAHDLLARVVAVGSDVTWVGSRALPTVVVDGVSVF